MSDLGLRFQAAVQQFWTGRDEALQRQIEAGQLDAGSRGAVTSGGHMGAIEALVVDLLIEAGLDRAHARTQVRGMRPQARMELPGYFRTEKRWDLLVVYKDQLVAAIEFKSQVGPSFGNNFNNRVEEALGNATDLWTAFREGRFGTVRPFLGYFFLLEDTPRVHTPVRAFEPYFPIDPAFGDASYARRYALLCRRLVLERLYDATCLTLATKSMTTEISFPSEDVSFRRFVAQLQGHIRGFIAGME
jgi:hypothetical protein